MMKRLIDLLFIACVAKAQSTSLNIFTETLLPLNSPFECGTTRRALSDVSEELFTSKDALIHQDMADVNLTPMLYGGKDELAHLIKRLKNRLLAPSNHSEILQKFESDRKTIKIIESAFETFSNEKLDLYSNDDFLKQDVEATRKSESVPSFLGEGTILMCIIKNLLLTQQNPQNIAIVSSNQYFHIF